MSEMDSHFLRRLVGTKVTTFLDFGLQQQGSVVSSSASAGPPPGASPPAASAPPSPATDSVPPATLTTATSTTASTLCFSGSPPPGIPGISRTWIITEKLSERAVYLTQRHVDMGVGSPMTVGKFLCCLEEDPTQIAFMRIYYQIPINGTEDADLATLAQQIQPREVCGELEAFRLLMSKGCSSVPRFRGYCERRQGENEFVPGGYAKYLVWEKVPGDPLTEEYFWGLDPHVRKDIRDKFRAAFEEVLRCGVQPQGSRISKIIYDQSTGNVRISGFRMVWPRRGRFEWSDNLYISYSLANPPKRPRKEDWISYPETWEY